MLKFQLNKPVLVIKNGVFFAESIFQNENMMV